MIRELEGQTQKQGPGNKLQEINEAGTEMIRILAMPGCLLANAVESVVRGESSPARISMQTYPDRVWGITSDASAARRYLGEHGVGAWGITPDGGVDHLYLHRRDLPGAINLLRERGFVIDDIKGMPTQEGVMDGYNRMPQEERLMPELGEEALVEDLLAANTLGRLGYSLLPQTRQFDGRDERIMGEAYRPVIART